jgi:1,4-alpha-glucan branching enzyme
MFMHPGKKLLFMGCDIGDYEEWNSAASVPWEVLEYPLHASLQFFVQELNRLYRSQPALYQVDFDYSGFEWIDIADVEKSTISFLRRASNRDDFVVIACNFTPVPRLNYDVGVPEPGHYEEVFNSDAAIFGGSNLGNYGGVPSREGKRHNRPCHIQITLPPLAVVVFRLRRYA